MSNTGLEEKVEKMNVEEREAKGQKGGKKTKGETRKKEDLSAFPLELNPRPAFIEERIVLFDKLKAQYDAQIEAKVLLITLLFVRLVVNGEVFDLDRVLEGDCSLEFLNFNDDEAKAVFWHSSAHIMGEAMERHYGGHLCYGPPIEEGYYYDMFCEGRCVSFSLVLYLLFKRNILFAFGSLFQLFLEKDVAKIAAFCLAVWNRQVSSNDYPSLDSLTKSIVKEKQPFVRLVMTKEELLEMFKYNEFKCRIIRQKINTPSTTVYRCGPLIDLCRGPHVRHTGKIKAMQVTKNSATYWEGNCEAESLQRLYGISFPNEKQVNYLNLQAMKEWKKFQEEAAKRDHRKLGRDHELFFFHELSPGSCFFLPKGAHIYNTLINFIKEEYRKRGFQEVVSPNIYSTKLWETSGHWQHYSVRH
ncbi:unnamed protein product [Porites evermanni]|uniref:Threonyl/alanyl tRNA synthetase SAD domain-containing protein n=1 Tax=Porites evermanni TaxID=104178 RepID=A0ABN8SP97_9CNID|nr:unnamed protein product [Porites evermanni]